MSRYEIPHVSSSGTTYREDVGARELLTTFLYVLYHGLDGLGLFRRLAGFAGFRSRWLSTTFPQHAYCELLFLCVYLLSFLHGFIALAVEAVFKIPTFLHRDDLVFDLPDMSLYPAAQYAG